jgi:hypothetical protein
MRRAARIDESQTAIVNALRKAGASATLIQRPVDAIVGFRGTTLRMESKTAGTYSARTPNQNQREFMATWLGGPVSMVDGPEAALRAIGVIA